MRIPWKTLNSGFSLPAYGFGLSEVGGGSWQADHSRDGEHIFALNRAMDAGIRHFDTAQGYGAGHAEELLGAALAGRDRAEFVIATKVSAVNQTYDGIMRAAQNSLKKLGVDHIDLYLMHTYPKPGMDIAEAMRGFNALIDQGIVRHIGGANLTPRRFAEAQRHSAARLVCNQVHYNVRYREPELRGVVEHARSNDVMLVAWRPLQAGHLPVPAMIRDIAQRYGRTPTQVALNWLISQPNVVVICKSSTPEHLEENLGALGWAMDVEDVEWIRRDFPNQITASDTVPMDYPAASAA